MCVCVCHICASTQQSVGYTLTHHSNALSESHDNIVYTYTAQHIGYTHSQQQVQRMRRKQKQKQKTKNKKQNVKQQQQNYTQRHNKRTAQQHMLMIKGWKNTLHNGRCSNSLVEE